MWGLLTTPLKWAAKKLLGVAAVGTAGLVGYKAYEEEIDEHVVEPAKGLIGTVKDGANSAMEFVEETAQDFGVDFDGWGGHSKENLELRKQGVDISGSSSTDSGSAPSGPNAVPANDLDQYFGQALKGGLSRAPAGYNLKRAFIAGEVVTDDDGHAILWYVDKNGLVETKDGPVDPSTITKDKFLKEGFSKFRVDTGMNDEDLTNTLKAFKETKRLELERQRDERGDGGSLLDKATGFFKDNPLASILGLGGAGAVGAGLLGKGGWIKTILVITGIAAAISFFSGGRNSNSNSSDSYKAAGADVHTDPNTGEKTVMTEGKFDQLRKEAYDKNMADIEEMDKQGLFDNDPGARERLEGAALRVSQQMKFEATKQEFWERNNALMEAEGLSREARIRVMQSAQSTGTDEGNPKKHGRKLDRAAKNDARDENKNDRHTNNENRGARSKTKQDLKQIEKNQGTIYDIVETELGTKNKPSVDKKLIQDAARGIAVQEKVKAFDAEAARLNLIQNKVVEAKTTGKEIDVVTTRLELDQSLKKLEKMKDDMDKVPKDVQRLAKRTVREEAKQTKEAQRVLEKMT